jgi:hypothetical protein
LFSFGKDLVRRMLDAAAMRTFALLLVALVLGCDGAAPRSFRSVTALGDCYRDDDCDRGYYCRFAPDSDPCGTNGSLGACFPLTLTCSQTAPQACGCDHKTYKNACQAWDEGHVGVLHDGACP